eukprot:429691_1
MEKTNSLKLMVTSTRTTEDIAKKFLDACSWNLEVAIDRYYFFNGDVSQINSAATASTFISQFHSKPYAQTLIANNWFRKCMPEKQIDNTPFAQIIAYFAKEIEIFDVSFANECDYKIGNNGLILNGYKSCDNERKFGNFGTIIAKIGNKYHWKLKLVKGAWNMFIGIVESDKVCVNTYKLYEKGVGYLWYGGGTLYYNQTSQTMGNEMILYHPCTIDIWLDFKDKYEVYFGRNDFICKVKCKLKLDKEYKLAVLTCNPTQLEIISFNMEYKN